MKMGNAGTKTRKHYSAEFKNQALDRAAQDGIATVARDLRLKAVSAAEGGTIHGERFVTREMVKAQVFEYIEVYYNRRRLHSRLGHPYPETFEARQMA